TVSRNHWRALFRLRSNFRKDVPISERHNPETLGNETGGLRAHSEGASVRHLPLPVAAGHEHIVGRDRECSYARKPDFTPALAHSSGSEAPRRVPEERSQLGGL